MNSIVNLLNSKNHYLEKFYSLNEETLKTFLNGDFESLDAFYDRREKILEVVRYLDARIEQEQLLIPEGATVSDSERRSVRGCLDLKDEFVRRILEQDLQILSALDREKSRMISELKSVEKGKNIGKFKSFTNRRRLNEEA